jgi:hypothetical protein
MQGKFAQIASKNFNKLIVAANEKVRSIASDYENLLRNKAINKVNGVKDSFLKSLNPNRDTKDLCNQDINIVNPKLNKLISKLKSLSLVLKNILKVLKNLQKFIKILKKVIIAFTGLVKLLKKLPIPNQFTIVGITNTLSDILNKISFKLKAALVMIIGIDLIITLTRARLKITSAAIARMLELLKPLAAELAACKNEYDVQELNEVIAELEEDNQALVAEFGLNKENDLGSHRGYTFEVVEEKTVDSVVATRRYVVALDPIGIVAYQGNPSFATDIQVLIDELKLQIDYEIDVKGNATVFATYEDINDVIEDDGETIDDILEEYDLPNDEELEESEKEALQAIEDAKTDSDKAFEESLNKKDKRFVKRLRTWESKYKDQKAKKLLSELISKTITFTKAKKEWRKYIVSNSKKFKNTPGANLSKFI